MVNLSDYSCNQNELSVLGKGLKFCPTPPKYCHGQLKESIDKFFRSASLKLFFSNNSNQDPEDILKNSFLSEEDTDTAFEHKELKLPSTFNPPMPNTLDHIYDILIDRILSHCPDFSRSRNVTLAQYKAMTRLKENNSIVIKKADKGSNVVIQNVTDYVQEVLRQLQDPAFYMKVNSDLTEKYREMVQGLISNLFLSKEISEKTFKFLSRGGHRTSIYCQRFIRINCLFQADLLFLVVTAQQKRFL